MTNTENTNLEFVKYRLTWRFTDDGELQESEFYLPWGSEPSEYVGSILSVVELSASEYGYEYDLKIVGCPHWTVDSEYFSECYAGDIDDLEYLNRVNSGEESCSDCLWVKDKDTCLYDECNEKDPVDLSRLELDKKWARLRKRIRESDEPIKVTGILTKSEEYSARVESDAMDWVEDHEREIANHFEAFEPW